MTLACWPIWAEFKGQGHVRGQGQTSTFTLTGGNKSSATAGMADHSTSRHKKE